MRTALVCIFSALLVSTTRPAGAAEADPKILLIDPESPALARRLREEIEALGAEVALAPPGNEAESLERRARTAGAIGAIRLSRTGAGAVEIVIVDRVTGKTVSRRLTITTPSDPASTELVATRTVELLRASLMELDASHPPRGDAPVSVEVRELANHDDGGHRIALVFGPALATAPGFGTAVDLWGAVSFGLSRRFAISASVLAPLTNRSRATTAGELELSEAQYRLGGSFDLVSRNRTVVPWVEAGACLAVLGVDGSAQSPYVAERDRSLAGGPWLGAGLALSLTRHVAVLAAADVAVLFPRTVVSAAENELGTWGRPLVNTRLGVEVEWQ